MVLTEESEESTDINGNLLLFFNFPGVNLSHDFKFKLTINFNF